MEHLVVIEYRLMEEGGSWEQTPVFRTVNFSELKLREQAGWWARVLADGNQSTVRWNQKGSTRGFFAQPGELWKRIDKKLSLDKKE